MAAIILIRVRSLLPPPAPDDDPSVVTVSVVSVTLSSMVGMVQGIVQGMVQGMVQGIQVQGIQGATSQVQGMVPVVALQSLLAREPGVEAVVGVRGRVDVGLVLAVLLGEREISYA